MRNPSVRMCFRHAVLGSAPIHDLDGTDQILGTLTHESAKFSLDRGMQRL